MPRREHWRLHWRKQAALRTVTLERDGYRCRKCGRAGRLEADHVVPLWRGGSHELHNMQALCVGCHVAKTQAEAMQRHGHENRVAMRRQFDGFLDGL